MTYIPGVGRLVTNRSDFENHIDGADFNHTADQIKLDPSVTIDGYTSDNLQSAVNKLGTIDYNLTVPSATDTVLGGIKLTNDLGTASGGTAIAPKVTGLQGYPVSNIAPTGTTKVLMWDNTAWKPKDITLLGDVTGTPSATVVTLQGDITGTVGSTTIAKLNGDTVEIDTPLVGQALQYDGSKWINTRPIYLRDKPISSTSPTSGQYLSYDGSEWAPSNIPTVSNATSSVTGIIKLLGDLAGTGSAYNDVKVKSLTGVGSVGSATATCSAQFFEFGSSITNEVYVQQAITNTTNAANLNIAAQTTDTSNDYGTGGNIQLTAGAANNSLNGIGGNIVIAAGGGGNSDIAKYGKITMNLMGGPEFDDGVMFQIEEIPLDYNQSVVKGRIISMAVGGDNMTSSSIGDQLDRVIYIGDTNISYPPTVGHNTSTSPTGGAILYSKNGKLYTVQEDGYGFSMDSEPNPKVKTFYSPINGVTCRTTKWCGTVQSSTTAVIIFSYTMANYTTIMIKGTLIGRKSGSVLNCICYDVNVAFSTADLSGGSGYPTRIITSNDFVELGSNFTSAPTGIPSTASGSANTGVFYIKTGYDDADIINWTLNIELHENHVGAY